MDIKLPFFNRINLKDRTFLIRQLAIMLESGIPLSNALSLVMKQTTNVRLREAIAVILKDIESGHPLSTAAGRYPGIFDQIMIAMLRTGEESGQLNAVLSQMADHLDKSMDFNAKVRNALLYPAFVIFVMFVVAILMTVVVIPKLAAVFTESGAQLPWTTTLLVFLSNLVIDYWYALIVILVLLAYGYRTYAKTPAGSLALYHIQTRLPLLKNLLINTYLVRFTTVLGMLIKAGVPITSALHIVSESMSNAVWQSSLQAATTDVEKGVALSSALVRHTQIPPALTEMIAVGEETGKLDEVLHNMADFYEKQTNDTVKGITALIEPVVLVIVALGVGFVVVAVILPIYSLSNQI